MYGKTVLIVDGEATVRHTLHRMLGNKHTVLEVMDGEAAINIARTFKLDLILIGIMMLKKYGYTACFEVKTNPNTNSIPWSCLLHSARNLIRSSPIIWVPADT